MLAARNEGNTFRLLMKGPHRSEGEARTALSIATNKIERTECCVNHLCGKLSMEVIPFPSLLRSGSLKNKTYKDCAFPVPHFLTAFSFQLMLQRRCNPCTARTPFPGLQHSEPFALEQLKTQLHTHRWKPGQAVMAIKRTCIPDHPLFGHVWTLNLVCHPGGKGAKHRHPAEPPSPHPWCDAVDDFQDHPRGT